MCISPSLFYTMSIILDLLSYLFSVVLYIYACASIQNYFILSKEFSLLIMFCTGLFVLKSTVLIFVLWLILYSFNSIFLINYFHFCYLQCHFGRIFLLYIVLWVGSNLLFFLYFKTVFWLLYLSWKFTDNETPPHICLNG